MSLYTRFLHEIDQADASLVGGKAVNLGELIKIPGIRVPNGFCVTTEAYRAVIEDNEELRALLDELTGFTKEQGAAIGEIGSAIRGTIESTPIPEPVRAAILACLVKFPWEAAFAIRSSATAEDLPTASFAGQQDSFLNIGGVDRILRHISKCWASLYTERAIRYRIQTGFDHSELRLAVIIQQMIFPAAAGIMFTADPVSCDRKSLSIDAGFGLGEALVSGLVNADNYTVRQDKIVAKKVCIKQRALYGAMEGGTETRELAPGRQVLQALTDDQILRLAQLGKKIETHFGHPQDIEWCLADDAFYFVQSRPITTLYPIPETNERGNHVYVSVGHQQMMTDAMKPLGLSMWQMMAFRPMFKAGGRLFIDVTQNLSSAVGRAVLLDTMGKHDPLIQDALMTIIERGFIPLAPAEESPGAPTSPPPKTAGDTQRMVGDEPSIKADRAIGEDPSIGDDSSVVTDLIRESQTGLKALRHDIQSKSGSDLLDFILEDIRQLKRRLADSKSLTVIMTAINAANWLNEHLKAWLGETNIADALSQSVSHNVTSDMGLALLDVADVIRPYPEITRYLTETGDEEFMDALLTFTGGRQVRDALDSFLDKYGMRCAGEIDITNTRWGERPSTLIPMILGNIKNFPTGSAGRKFEKGRDEALKKEEALLDRLQQLPDGNSKATEARRRIRTLRNLTGYREYPKYQIVSHFFDYKQAMMKEAHRLVDGGVISDTANIYYLTFEELREVVRTKQLDDHLISERIEEHRRNERLHAPRVITSDGEIVTGRYIRGNYPPGTLPGLPVSAGVAEGRARIVRSIAEADLADGDILVTAFTDPGWTALFVSIKGLVTEVGGLMTHGAVIAREYGLPAVVGVVGATQLIRDGQRIRVNGTEGLVEILD